MIAPDCNLLCGEAKLYYYDFLCDESRRLIPGSIINHIQQCRQCNERINQLKVMLSQTDSIEPEQRHVNSAITAMLELHFAYIDKYVTCETVRPFLPGLLDPALEIRIPTPITAHLDNCQHCAEDLKMFQRLNLNNKQLCRLSQLFAEKPCEDLSTKSEMEKAVKSVVFLNFDGITTETLNTLCKFPVYRDLLYQERQKMCNSLSEDAQSLEFPCESVSATDIFDYVVPYGLDPADDQYAKFRESLASHLRNCPTCLAKMQQLHDTVYGISERAESGVVTIYHIDESAKAHAVSESDDLYAGFPISVEIAGREDKVKAEQPVPIIDFITALKQKISSSHLKPLLKPAITVAAVILIGFALLLNTPTAKAITMEQIYKAIEKVKNVYISKSVSDRAEPTQKKWVSRTLNIYMTKTKLQWVLWDIAKGLRTSKDSHTGVIDTVQLTEDEIAGIEQKMSGSLGLTPPKIPPGVELCRVDDQILEVAEGIEIYDLEWTERKYGGSTEFKIWRVFADAKTSLPQRVEWYTRFADDAEFVLETVMVVEYLDESEIRKVKDAGF